MPLLVRFASHPAARFLLLLRPCPDASYFLGLLQTHSLPLRPLLLRTLFLEHPQYGWHLRPPQREPFPGRTSAGRRCPSTGCLLLPPCARITILPPFPRKCQDPWEWEPGASAKPIAFDVWQGGLDGRPRAD